ncbi:MAG: Pr6Pr family membrane protein [Clostridia bacterium]|nr:Pr6Pr family membrane protein [Clostridia bacterium]
MDKTVKRNLETFIQIFVLVITVYFAIVPFFKPSPSHLEIKLPRHVFYTIQTNIIVCGWCLYLILRRFVPRLPVIHQGLALSITVYITITGLVYWAILVPMLGATPALFGISNIWLHTVTPIFCIWCFLNFSKKSPVRRYHVALMMVYPTLYYFYTFIVNARYGKFPYPFLDVNAMGGLGGVIFLCLLILGLFFLLGWAYRKIYDRRLLRESPSSQQVL